MSANPKSSGSPLDEAASVVSEMRPALVKYFSRKTGNTVEAEDLAQDVLLSALRHPHWKSKDQAKGYIFRTAVNRWRDNMRRLRVRGGTIPWDEELQERCSETTGVENSPERVLMVGQELHQVMRALEEMNVRTRTVLMLIKLEQMRVATVAKMLGISPSAVAKHLARGIAQLAALRKQQDLP